MDIADVCALVISAFSLIISLYNAIVPNLSKINVSIRYEQKYKYHETGRSFNPSCFIIVKSFSKRTKYIQSVYVFYKFSMKSKYNAKFLISDEIFTVEPQQIIKIPFIPPKGIFEGGPNLKTKVYAAVIDSSGKVWESHDFVTIGYLQELSVYTRRLS